MPSFSTNQSFSPLIQNTLFLQRFPHSFLHQMAMAKVVLSPPSSIARATMDSGNRAQRRKKKVEYVRGFNSFEGLKAHDSVVTLGRPTTTEKCFAKMVVKSLTKGKVKRGGALSSTGNAAGEIFQIAAIMNGLVLVDVAVGFVLLRVEAWVEESEL